MRKQDVVKSIASKTGIERAEIDVTVNAFFAIIKQRLAEGESVHFRGFGSFIVKKRAPKKARNITRNQTVIIPERFVPLFKPSEIFLEHFQPETELAENQ